MATTMMLLCMLQLLATLLTWPQSGVTAGGWEGLARTLDRRTMRQAGIGAWCDGR